MGNSNIWGSQPIIEQLSKDSNTAYIEHDPVTGEPLMLRTSAGMESLYITDGTGNPTALIAAGNYVSVAYAYDPYGVQTITKDAGGNATDQTPYTFKCGLQDRTTGWVHYGARWYDPTTGRWTQQDTQDTPLDPANANRYAYAGNNPTNNADPLGIDTLHDAVNACAGLSHKRCIRQFSLVVFSCRESVAEGDGEGVQSGLPAHGPSGSAGTGRIE